MSNEFANFTFTEKELAALSKLEAQYRKVQEAFKGKTVKLRDDTVLVSAPGSNIEIEYDLKKLLREIQKKERGTYTGRYKTPRALKGKGKSKSTRKSRKGVSVAVGANNANRAERSALQKRLRDLRRIKREQKKLPAVAGAGAGAGAARSPSSSKNSSTGSNNNMAELVAGLGDMSVAGMKSEIQKLEEELARMGL